MKDKIEDLIFVGVVLFILFATLCTLFFFKKQSDNQMVSSFTVENKKIYTDIDVTLEIYYKTRLTSFYTGDECNTGSITASGLSTKDFETNDEGWYIYQDKLVVASASTRLGSTDMKTYSLYDELILKINDKYYNAIVLDVCGACMKYNRLDLFVSGRNSVIDTTIEVMKFKRW